MLILLRHGRTVANAARRLQGRVDHPLDELGIAQAAAQAAVLGPVDRIVTSPLLRAVQTAAAVAAVSPGVEVEVDERFVELSYGEWEDLPLDDVPVEEWARWRKDPDFAPPGGETLGVLDERVRAACEELTPSADGGTVVVCSHVSPIKSAVAWALDVPFEATWRMHLDTGSRCHIVLRQGVPVLSALQHHRRGRLMRTADLAAVPRQGVTHDPHVLKRVLLGAGAVPHLTNLSQAELLAGQAVSGHAHVDMHEVFLVEAGAGTMTVDGDEVDLRAGVCVVVEPGEAHRIVQRGDAPLVLTYFGIA